MTANHSAVTSCCVVAFGGICPSACAACRNALPHNTSGDAAQVKATEGPGECSAHVPSMLWGCWEWVGARWALPLGKHSLLLMVLGCVRMSCVMAAALTLGG